MNEYSAALSQHPEAAVAVGEIVGQILDEFGEGPPPDLAVLFVSPDHLGAFASIASAVRTLLGPRVLIGQSALWVAGGELEVEGSPAISLFAARLPDGDVTPVVLDVERTPDGVAVVGWPDDPPRDSTLLLLADPFTFPIDGFLARTNDEHPDLQVIGGLASAANGPGINRLVLDDAVTARGAVGVLIEGVDISTVVSQGCRPVGQPYTVTAARENLVLELGGRRAMERLQTIANEMPEEERALLSRGLHVGIVVDERKVDFDRGDFLVRNVLGGSAETGAIAIGDTAVVGTTVQFHTRDAFGADEDLRHLLGVASDRPVGGALLFTCNGRGTPFFGVPNHDADAIQDVLGYIPLAGCCCAGEIGPIGGRTFLHGFTASVALFN
jgi:small ligand-binding sensory domain FIST